MNQFTGVNTGMHVAPQRQSLTDSCDVTAPSAKSQVPQRSTSLRFHIERLTLAGLPRANQKKIVSAMRQKLAELSRELPRVNWSKLSTPFRIDGGEIAHDATSEDIGSHLAVTIMRSLMDADNRSAHVPEPVRSAHLSETRFRTETR